MSAATFQGRDGGPDEDGLFVGGGRHARFHAESVVYHVLLRVVQGRHLLRPDPRGQLSSLIAGVMGRACELYPEVQVFGDAWLSNHAHLLVRGPAHQLPAFVGFLTRETSRRWGRVVGWDGRMFDRYRSTALPTEESQVGALSYVLSHSVKEGLVGSPLEWPGLHCARDLLGGLVRKGTWVDGTAYSRACHKSGARRASARPRPSDFERTTVVRFSRLPACQHQSAGEYRKLVEGLVRRVEEEGASARKGRNVLGLQRLMRTPRTRRTALPKTPWTERRRRMVVWASRSAAATRAYLREYWGFQRAFREASARYLAGEADVDFPAGAFRPCLIALTKG